MNPKTYEQGAEDGRAEFLHPSIPLLTPSRHN